jgi:hypothetical protein
MAGAASPLVWVATGDAIHRAPHRPCVQTGNPFRHGEIPNPLLAWEGSGMAGLAPAVQEARGLGSGNVEVCVQLTGSRAV